MEPRVRIEQRDATRLDEYTKNCLVKPQFYLDYFHVRGKYHHNMLVLSTDKAEVGQNVLCGVKPLVQKCDDSPITTIPMQQLLQQGP